MIGGDACAPQGRGWWGDTCPPGDSVPLPSPPPSPLSPPPPSPECDQMMDGRIDIWTTQGKWCTELKVKDAVGGCGAYYSRNANNRKTRVCYQKDHDDKRCTASEALKCAAPKPSPSPPAAPPPPPDTSVAPAITTEKTIQPGESKTDFKARCLEACLSGGQCLGYSMDKSQSACTIYTVNV